MKTYFKILTAEQKKTLKEEVASAIRRLITPCNYSKEELITPCPYKPGTPKRAEIMAARALMDLPLFVKGDASEYSDSNEFEEEEDLDFDPESEDEDFLLDLDE